MNAKQQNSIDFIKAQIINEHALVVLDEITEETAGLYLSLGTKELTSGNFCFALIGKNGGITCFSIKKGSYISHKTQHGRRFFNN